MLASVARIALRRIKMRRPARSGWAALSGRKTLSTLGRALACIRLPDWWAQSSEGTSSFSYTELTLRARGSLVAGKHEHMTPRHELEIYAPQDRRFVGGAGG